MLDALKRLALMEVGAFSTAEEEIGNVISELRRKVRSNGKLGENHRSGHRGRRRRRWQSHRFASFGTGSDE